MAVPVLWRTQKQRYSLQAEVCTHCSSAVFPPRAVCPYCKTAMHAHVVLQDCLPTPVALATQPTAQGREFIYATSTHAQPMLVAATGDD